jgi:hypothetical protein
MKSYIHFIKRLECTDVGNAYLDNTLLYPTGERGYILARPQIPISVTLTTGTKMEPQSQKAEDRPKQQETEGPLRRICSIAIL